ncbi:MAG: hypothetical protein WCJ60_02290 [bacterium]
MNRKEHMKSKIELPAIDQIRLYEALTGFEFKQPLNETEVLKIIKSMGIK